MCGIAGIFTLNSSHKNKLSNIAAAIKAIAYRGPDAEGIFTDEHIALGHRRLRILDTTDNARQPMSTSDGKLIICFNGEIFNYKELKTRYFPEKADWISQSDTELFLYLYAQLGAACFSLLEGFFAAAFYHVDEQKLVLVRDRFGKKPLYYINQPDQYLAFASEINALHAYRIPLALDNVSLRQYLHFNYIPEPNSIYREVHKLAPGTFLEVSRSKQRTSTYYTLDFQRTHWSGTYDQAMVRLESLLDHAVQQRLISDVPLGAFLSGGIDSSVVVALASRHVKRMHTFSIGYADQPFFDETHYAQLVAKRFQTDHHVFSLRSTDFLEHLDPMLDNLTEPFADSSALPLYILCKKTRPHVTVALSGDGGDEVFAGYNKHVAEWRVRAGSLLSPLIKVGHPLWRLLPKSRNGFLSNKIRQLDRYAAGSKMSDSERYWSWAGFLSDSETLDYLSATSSETADYSSRKSEILQPIGFGEGLNDFLATDMRLVLLSDMLVKVDRMSMANGLEVRSPLLDHRVVDFAFSLPTNYKLGQGLSKRILQDTFRKELPVELYNRPKKGFEIPLLGWFRNELRARIEHDWLDEDFVMEQGIFNREAIRILKQRLFSSNPGDAHATVWALIVFQSWWRRTATRVTN